MHPGLSKLLQGDGEAADEIALRRWNGCFSVVGGSGGGGAGELVFEVAGARPPPREVIADLNAVRRELRYALLQSGYD